MKKRHVMAILLAAALVLSGCSQSPAPPEEPADAEVLPEEPEQVEDIEPALLVMASFYPYYDMARKIGGELVEVNQMVPDGVDPHSYEPSPRDLIQLEESHVFIYNGLEMEIWLEGALYLLEDSEARLIEAGELVELLPFGGNDDDHDHGHDHDHDHDHDDDDDDHHHGDWDPHIWTDPMNMKTIAGELAAILSDLDPANASVYQENYDTYAAAIDELDEALKSLAENADQKIMLVSHSAFGYLAERYGFREIAVAGVNPHAEPNPGRLAELVRLAREYELEYIFFETLANPRTAEVLANEAGLTPLMLQNLEGLTQEQRDAGEDYFSLMHENISTLRQAMVKE